MKQALCKAFCEEISIRSVPFGLAVRTGFDGFGGDPIGFYVSNPDERGNVRVQDDGRTIFLLESQGADLDVATRLAAFESLLTEYGFEYDEESQVIRSSLIGESELPAKALRFVALLLRVQDIALLVEERAASTFREEVMRRLREQVGNRAEINEKAAVHPLLKDYPADVVIRAQERAPVALFFGTSDKNVDEAVIMQLVAQHEAKVDCSVIAILETESRIAKRVKQRAVNRLAAVPFFRGDEKAAIDRITREVLGGSVH